MHAYSQDLRERVLGTLERGERPSDVARRYEVSRVWVYQVRKRLVVTGLRTSLPIGGHRRSCVAQLEATIHGWIKAQPDLTLAQLCERLAQQDIQIKPPALWHQLDKWQLSLKKKHCTPASKSEPTCRARAVIGSKPSPRWMPRIWSFWTRPGPTPA